MMQKNWKSYSFSWFFGQNFVGSDPWWSQPVVLRLFISITQNLWTCLFIFALWHQKEDFYTSTSFFATIPAVIRHFLCFCDFTNFSEFSSSVVDFPPNQICHMTTNFRAIFDILWKLKLKFQKVPNIKTTSLGVCFYWKINFQINSNGFQRQKLEDQIKVIWSLTYSSITNLLSSTTKTRKRKFVKFFDLIFQSKWTF